MISKFIKNCMAFGVKTSFEDVFELFICFN